jgi:proton glutamate symport protein
MAYTIGKGGFAVLYNLAWLVGTLYIALAVFYLLVLLPVMLLFKISVRKFFAAVREPAVIAFSTTSSEAALPRAMEAMERLGVPRSVVAFVLPLDALQSRRLDAVSLARGGVRSGRPTCGCPWPADHDAADADADSKGVAGVPRASLVILAATLAHNLPLEGSR